MSLLESIFKSLIWDNVVEAALSRLFIAVPLLGWGPIGYVIAWAVVRISDMIFAGIKTFVDVQAIKLKNEAAQNEFERRNIRLQLVARDSGIDSKEFKEARQYDKDALSRFVRFDVARVS